MFGSLLVLSACLGLLQADQSIYSGAGRTCIEQNRISFRVVAGGGGDWVRGFMIEEGILKLGHEIPPPLPLCLFFIFKEFLNSLIFTNIRRTARRRQCWRSKRRRFFRRSRRSRRTGIRRSHRGSARWAILLRDVIAFSWKKIGIEEKSDRWKDKGRRWGLGGRSWLNSMPHKRITSSTRMI